MPIRREKKGSVRVWKRPETGLLYIHVIKNAVSRECFIFDRSVNLRVYITRTSLLNTEVLNHYIWLTFTINTVAAFPRLQFEYIKSAFPVTRVDAMLLGTRGDRNTWLSCWAKLPSHVSLIDHRLGCNFHQYASETLYLWSSSYLETIG